MQFNPDQFSGSIEERRASLWQSFQKHPKKKRLLHMLRASLKPVFIRQAAERGIFVCYHRSDEMLALELSTRLKTAGMAAWMDELDMPVEGDWWTHVSAALRRCGVLLLVVSESARRDDIVQTARHFFLRSGKIVLPVTQQPDIAAQWELQLPPVDFSEDFDAAWARLRYLLVNDEASV
jgi:hypothetical protein